MEPELKLAWVKRGECFYSSPDGRFDLMRSAYLGDWVCIDAEEGKRFRGDPGACERWRMGRAKQKAGAKR